MTARALVYGLAALIVCVATAAFLVRHSLAERLLISFLSEQGYADIRIEAIVVAPDLRSLAITRLTAESSGTRVDASQVNVSLINYQVEVMAESLQLHIKTDAADAPPTIGDILTLVDPVRTLPVGFSVATETLTLCAPACQDIAVEARAMNSTVEANVVAEDWSVALSAGQQFQYVANNDDYRATGSLNVPKVNAAEGQTLTVHTMLEATNTQSLVATEDARVIASSLRLRAVATLAGDTPLSYAAMTNALTANAVLYATTSVELDTENINVRYGGDNEYLLELMAGKASATQTSDAAVKLHGTDVSATALVAATSTCHSDLEFTSFACNLIMHNLAATTLAASVNAPQTSIALTTTGKNLDVNIRGHWQITVQDWPELKGDIEINANDTIAEASMNNALLGAIPLQTLNLKANLSSAAVTFNAGSDTTLKALSALPFMADFENLAGDLHIKTSGAWHQTKGFTNLVSETTLHNGVLTYDGYDVVGINGALTMAGYPQHATSNPATVSIQLVDIGVPVRDLKFMLDTSLGLNSATTEFSLNDFSAQMLGGSVSSSTIDGNYQESLNASAIISLTDLDLNQILAIERDEFMSEGKIGGSVPVQVKNGNLTISAGMLSAAAPGGFIRYQPDTSLVASLANNDQVSFVVDTLADFQYHSLNAEVSYTPDGDMIALTTIQGSNPAIENGREIKLNLKLEENVGTLLRSLRISEVFTDRIEQRAQKE